MQPNSDTAWPWGRQQAQASHQSNLQTLSGKPDYNGLIYPAQASHQSNLQTLAPPPRPIAPVQMRPVSPPSFLAEMPMPMPPVPPGNYMGGPPGRQPQWKDNKRRKRRFPMWARVTVAMLLVMIVLGGVVGGYLYSSFSAPVGNIVNQQVQRA